MPRIHTAGEASPGFSGRGCLQVPNPLARRLLQEHAMPSLGKTTLTGGSGKPYRFRMYPLGTKFRQKSGVYVITNRSHSDGGRHRHATLYIGQTEDVSQP